MPSKNLFSKKVKAIKIKTPKSISQLLQEMQQTGFQGKKLAEIASVYEKMIKDKKLTIIMGYAGSLSTTGQWKIINWLIENRFIDVLVATGANLSEDIIEAMGYSYWQGSHLADDSGLLKANVNRYYDVYGKETEYMEMTEMLADFYTSSLQQNHPYSSREILCLFGQWLQKKKIMSIVAVAAKHQVPIFCPAIVDSPYGDAGLIAKSKGFNLIIDSMKDYTEFMRLGEKIKDTGVIYIGGGVPKDFIQLLAVTSNLLYPEREIPGRKPEIFRAKRGRKKELIETYYPHKYAIQITTDSPQWGGLSGCTFEEAMSWGKEAINAPKIQCYCDATIALPIIAQALAERVSAQGRSALGGKTKRKGTDFSDLFKV